MKALVTGATGFIGRHLTRELLSEGHQVSVAVRNPEKVGSLRLDRIKGTFFLDLEDIPEIDLWSHFGRPDVVFHLAWEGLPNYSSLHHLEQNVPRHYKFLKGLAESGCPKVLVTGTCAEYGKRAGVLQEETPPCPKNAYATAKYVLYMMTRLLFEKYNRQLVWVRIFYVSGERGRASLFDQLMEAIRRGKESFDLTGGEQLRDYLSVDEVAVKLRQIAEKTDRSMVVNVGSGCPVSVRSLVESIVRDNDSDIQLNWGSVPYPEDESMAFWADVTRLKCLLSSGTMNGSD